MLHKGIRLGLHGNSFYKQGRPISFLLMNLYLILHILQLYSDHILRSFPRNIVVESDDGSHLESLLMLSDQEHGYYKCMCTQSLTTKRRQYIVPYFAHILTTISLNLWNNSDQTLFSNTLTFAWSRGRCRKPRPTGRC